MVSVQRCGLCPPLVMGGNRTRLQKIIEQRRKLRIKMERLFLSPCTIRSLLPLISASNCRLTLRRRLLKIPRCQKMFVPGFGEASPESKAARNLQNFFTFVAVKIVLSQLESYNTEGYKELMEFVERKSLNDGDKFCSELMRESPAHKGLALRILEVRSAYTKRDFEWDNLQKLAFKMVDESNTKLMREYILETSSLENSGNEDNV